MRREFSRTAYRYIKRGLDIAGAAALLGVTAPVGVAAAIAVRSESRGAVFFSHERLGMNGRHIRVLKFRSMSQGAEDIEAVLTDADLESYYREYKLRNDPRVTETGRFLRRSSLDELPQLINVIRGDMSLVGPRPVTEQELGFYTEEEVRRLLSVRPGLTGWWQVYGRDTAGYENGRRQEMELYYADNISLIMDAELLIRTPLAVINHYIHSR